MAQRRKLSAVTLAGARSVVRRFAFGLVAVLAAMTAIGYVLPAHRVGDATWFHSNLDDGGPASVIVCAVVMGVWWFARRRGYGAGFLLGPVAVAGAIGAVVPVFLEHLFSRVENGYGEAVYATGVIGLFFAGIAVMVLEPILYVGQRRQLERDVDPQFPTARVVA